MSASKGKSAPRHSGGKLSPSRTINRKITESSAETTTIREKFNGWRLGISIDSEDIIKAFVIAALMVFFTILQTTLFTRFRPFGAVPDLMLPFVMATAAIEKEKADAATAKEELRVKLQLIRSELIKYNAIIDGEENFGAAASDSALSHAISNYVTLKNNKVEKDSALEAAKAALENAQTALETAQTELEAAQKAYDEAVDGDTIIIPIITYIYI
jgi:hypothetical protein